MSAARISCTSDAIALTHDLTGTHRTSPRGAVHFTQSSSRASQRARAPVKSCKNESDRLRRTSHG